MSQTTQTSDFLYTNAPLVEVIAEVRWQLQALQSSPEARIDPYFELFREDFSKWAASVGYVLKEQLVPPEVPMEILPYKPFVRFRKAPEQWPLYQIGPGLFTANIIPPYQGWKDYRSTLLEGISGLLKTYPLREKTLNINRLHLRYIDAFTEKFGLEQYGKFLEQHLNIPKLLPEALLTKFVPEPHYPEAKVVNKFSTKTPQSSFGVISINPGKANNKRAVVVELICQKEGSFGALSIEQITAWFDEAHLSVRDWFDSLVSDAIKEMMGPKKPIEGKK